MACRVNLEPAVSRVIESSGLPPSFIKRVSLVSSPNAANKGAFRRSFPATPLRVLRDMGFDVFDLLGPASIVPPEDLGTLSRWNRVEAGLG